MAALAVNFAAWRFERHLHAWWAAPPTHVVQVVALLDQVVAVSGCGRGARTGLRVRRVGHMRTTREPDPPHWGHCPLNPHPPHITHA